MNRQVVAGLLVGLALAGCGPDRALPKRTATQATPVGITPPMDSIHANINGPNTGSPATNAGTAATASAKEETAPAAGAPAEASLAVANPPSSDTILPSPLAAESSSESQPTADPSATAASANQATQASESTRKPVPRVASEASTTYRDPLLGANPDLMPVLNDPPASANAAQSSPPFKQNIPDIVPSEKATTTTTTETAIAPAQAAHPPTPATIPDIVPGSIESSAPPTPSPIEPAKQPVAASIPDIVPHAAGTATPSTAEPVSQPLLDGVAPPPAGLTEPAAAKEQAPPGETLPKLPTDLVMPAETPTPAGTSPLPSAPPVGQAASKGGDPLLGANPNLMPVLEPSPDPSPSPVAAGRLGAPPSVRDIATKPAAGPAPATAPAPKSSVLPTLDLPSSARPPAETPAAAPASQSKPEPMPAEPGDTVDPQAPSPSAAKPDKTEGSQKPGATADATEPPSKLDPEVKTAALDPTTVHSELPSRVVFSAGRAVAKVGDEIITRRELDFAQREFLKSIPGADRSISREERVLLAHQSLNKLIERSVVTQEARRTLKDPKKIKSFMEGADKVWMDEELPPLLRKTGAVNIHELKAKMEREGESLDDARESYRQDFLAKNFLQMKLIPKMKVELPEMRKYYDEHINDFNVPAEIAWREILIEVGKSSNPEDARRKAESILERLKRGEDFANIARAESDGPNKAEGGLWRLEPKSYAVPTVTSALEILPAGEISGILEGPKSFHIVRVENRRPAGPESFAAVQDKIRQILHAEKIHKESSAYLDSLRNKTVVINYVEQGMFGKTAAAQ
jgi:parvulin-like peptidyl-prolyl isomerase